MVYFLLLQLTHKDSILHYKAVKVTIHDPDYAEIILNIYDVWVTAMQHLIPISIN